MSPTLAKINVFWRLGCLLVLISFCFCGKGIKQESLAPSIGGASSVENPDGTVTVTIVGSGFVEGMTVAVDGNACTDVRVLSSTQLTCRLPNGNIALVNIIVTTPNGGSSGGGTTPSSHILFVSSGRYNADFLTGQTITYADTLCSNLANAAGRGTGWTAVLSTDSVSAKDRITITGKIYNTHGDLIANGASDLWDGNIQNAVGYDETGVFSNVTMMTGSMQDGTTAGVGHTCNNWTSIANPGSGYDNRYLGISNVSDYKWIAHTPENPSANCNNTTNRAIYCFK